MIINTRKIFLIAFSLMLCSCHKDIKENKGDSKSDVNSSSPSSMYLKKFLDKKKLDSLTFRIVMKGDTLAYNEASDIYFLSGTNPKDFFYYALLMSNKYHYARAKNDLIFICKGIPLDSLNGETKIIFQRILENKEP